MPSLTDDSTQMTSSKHAIRHQHPYRSRTPDHASTPEFRMGRISLHIDGDPDELGPFLDLSSKAANCFKPRVKIIEKATSSSSSSTTKTISKRSSASSSPSLSSSPSMSSSSTLSSGSKEKGDLKSSKNGNHSSYSSKNSNYLKSENSHCSAERSSDSVQDSTVNISDCFKNSTYPAYTVTVFLRHMDADPSERLKPNATPRDKRTVSLMKHLNSDPWKIHHIERVDKTKVKVKEKGDSDCACCGSDNRGSSDGGSCSSCNGNGGEKRTGEKINTLTSNRPKNSLSSPVVFYHMSPNLPLWSLRQAHHGCEHFRIVLNTPDHLWDDQVKFYSLVLGLDLDLLREDFCLFNVLKETGLDYDIQLALKRLPPDVSVDVLNSVHIQIKVRDLGKLIALLPNVCQPISDVLWETTDHLGNRVVFNVIRSKQHRRESLSIEDAVYECMSLPIMQSLNNNYKILQEVEENSKCTQTSPMILSGDGGSDGDNNNKDNDCVLSGEGNGDGGGRSGKKKSSIKNQKVHKSDGSVIDVGDDFIYENCFEAKYDDLDVYVNCDNLSKSNYSTMCNLPCSNSNSISALTCKVKPPPRNADCRNNYFSSEKERQKQCSKKSNNFVNCADANKPGATVGHETLLENRYRRNDTVESDITDFKHSDEGDNCDSNGYVVLTKTDYCRSGTANPSRGFPILISDEDIDVEFHRSFSSVDDATCSSIDTVGKALQEDEESLTLTNLSEESGIIVLHDDDGIWCEGEGEGDIEGEGGRTECQGKVQGQNIVMRPCLRKHSGNGNRDITSSSKSSRNSDSKCNQNSNNNRKVRFSDEIKSFVLEPFLDDSQSHLSSGFESDEQSDDDADMRISRKQRHSHHNHNHHHHYHSSSSSRTSFKNHCKDSVTLTEDSITSFQKGVDSWKSEIPATSNNNEIPSEKTKTFFDECDNDYNANSNSYNQQQKSRRRVQKCHSDIVPSHYTIMKASTSENNVRTVAKQHNQYPVSSLPSPGVLFRPICPPSYEVALATKRKIQQKEIMKKKNSLANDTNANHPRHHDPHHHQHDPHHHHHQQQQQRNSTCSDVIDHRSKEKHTNGNNESNIHKVRANSCNEPIKQSDLYKESIKTHTNQRADLVRNNSVSEINRALPVESDVDVHRDTPTFRTLSCKNDDTTTAEKCSTIHCDDPPPATHHVQSTSNIADNSFTQSKNQNLVGILRWSVPQKHNGNNPYHPDRERDENNDVTTNFTLRFDTCPMSGGKPRKEQTGFYV